MNNEYGKDHDCPRSTFNSTLYFGLVNHFGDCIVYHIHTHIYIYKHTCIIYHDVPMYIRIYPKKHPHLLESHVGVSRSWGISNHWFPIKHDQSLWTIT